MSAYVCEKPCDIVWPFYVEYRTCPGCGLSTTVAPGRQSSMTEAQAAQKAADLTLARDRHEQFADFVLEREGPDFRAELDNFQGVT